MPLTPTGARTAARRDLLFAVGVHLARFAVIVVGLAVAPLLGITGWYAGLFVNVLCTLFAATVVTWQGLWSVIGLTTLWRGPLPALLLLVPLAEAVSWTVPDGLVSRPPGFTLWALSLLLVGLNEELTSRGVVLERLRRSHSALGAVTLTAALFGLQHLSAFATGDRGAVDVLGNVLASATYGFTLAAFQYRFRWLWPLVLVHALADLTTITSAAAHGDAWVAVTMVVFVGYGLVVLRPVLRPVRHPVPRPVRHPVPRPVRHRDR